MRIGLIGSGRIGGTLARLAVDAGHEVVLSNSRGPETLAALVAELGSGATAGTVAQAAQSGDVVVVTIPLKEYATVPSDLLDGRIVVDTNNYYPGGTGTSRSSMTPRRRQANCSLRTWQVPSS